VKKEDLRLKFKQIRREHLSARDFDAAALKRNVKKAIADLGPKAQVCLYRPLSDEVGCDLAPLTDFYFPRIDGQNLQFFKPRSAKAFSKSRFGISEPIPEKSRALDLSQDILVFCPAVAVDTLGTRLGMGKGYYDRFFHANPRALRLALVLQAQVSKTVFMPDPWDQPVDWIVSEQMILKPSLKGVRSHGSQFAS